MAGSTAKDQGSPDLYEACLGVGLELLREVGIDALSLREVARRAGVSPSAPYKHFPNKEALLAAMATRGFETLERYVMRSCPGGVHLHTRESFLRMGEEYVRFAEEHPQYFRLMFTNAIPEHRKHPALWEVHRRTLRLLLQSMEVLQRAGEIREDDPQRLAVHILSLLNGFVSIHLEGRIEALEVPPGSMTERFAAHGRLLFEGLLPR